MYFSLEYVYYWYIWENPCICEEFPPVFTISGADVRDIWQGKTVTGVQTQYSQKISSHDTLLVVLGPPTTPPGPPSPPTPPGPPSPPPPPPPGPPSKCSVVLTKQVSKTKCELSKSGAPSTRNRYAPYYAPVPCRRTRHIDMMTSLQGAVSGFISCAIPCH